MSISHFARMNVSRHTYERDRNKMNEIHDGACYIYDKSHHTYQWVKSHMSMSHFTRMNVTHHTTGTRWTKSTTAQWVWSDCATNPIPRSFAFGAYFPKKSLNQYFVSYSYECTTNSFPFFFWLSYMYICLNMCTYISIRMCVYTYIYM